jgi:hypothetical protein
MRCTFRAASVEDAHDQRSIGAINGCGANPDFLKKAIALSLAK